MKQKTIFALAAVGLLFVFIVAALLHNAERETQDAQSAAVDPTLLVRMHSPTMGKADAPVVIVEFLDPACGTCRAFYPKVKEMMAANPDKIRLVVRYAPFHQGSDKVVAMLEAARKQGKFWPALEALLGAQAAWTVNHVAVPERAWQQLEGIGLNMEQMAFDITAPEIAALIAQDIADAAKLNVSKTPEFFVNGKPLPSFGYEELKALVDAALAAARKV